MLKAIQKVYLNNDDNNKDDSKNFIIGEKF